INTLPECVSGRIASDAGLYTYELAESGAIKASLVQSGWGSDSLYHVYEGIDVSSGGADGVSAVNHETPPPFHIFAGGPGAWQKRQTIAPPGEELAAWTRIQALSDGTQFFVGSVVRTAVSPMLSSLIAGVLQPADKPSA